MEYIEVQPVVAGDVWTLSKTKHTATDLLITEWIFAFYGSDFEDFFCSVPYFFVTEKLKKEIQSEDLTGTTFQEIKGVIGEEAQKPIDTKIFLMVPVEDCLDPDFDFGANEGTLMVSQKARSFLESVGMRRVVFGRTAEDDAFDEWLNKQQAGSQDSV